MCNNLLYIYCFYDNNVIDWLNFFFDFSHQVRMANGEERSIRCAYAVVAAGAQTGNICYDHMGMGKAEEGIMAYPVPIEPR